MDWSAMRSATRRPRRPRRRSERREHWRRRKAPRRWHTPALAGAVAAAAIVAIVTIPRVGDDTLDDVGPMTTTPPASAPDDNPFSVPQATMDTTAPVPTSERVTTAPPTTEPRSTTAPSDEACRQQPEALTAALLEARRNQTVDSDCTEPVSELFVAVPEQPPCWYRCADGRDVVHYDWGEPVRTETADGLQRWVVSTVVEYAGGDDPARERVRESWTFSDDEGVLELIDLQAVSTGEQEQTALDAVGAFHEALSAERWDEAAELLYPGSVELDERADLVALFDAALLGTDSKHDNVADALRAWCEAGALCQQPSDLTLRIDHDAVTVTASYPDQATTGAFRGVEVGGQPAIMGLPPNPTLTWRSRITVNFDSGRIAAAGFNEHITENAPVTARTPVGAVKVLLNRSYGFAETWVAPSEREVEEIVVVTATDNGATIQVTVSNLLDDSAAAVRYTIELESSEDGLYRFGSGAWATRCQPGRGHQEFLPDPCT